MIIQEGIFLKEYNKLNSEFVPLVEKLQKAVIKDKRAIPNIPGEMEKILREVFKIKTKITIIDDTDDPLYNCMCIPLFKYGEMKVDTDKLKLKTTGLYKLEIYLYISLLLYLTPKEVTAVLLHEIGHAFQREYELEISYIASRILSSIYVGSILFSLIRIAVFLIASTVVLGLVSLVLLLTTWFSLGYSKYRSRDIEHKADLFATQFGFGSDLASALEKLDKMWKTRKPRGFFKILFHTIKKHISWIIDKLSFGSTHPTVDERKEEINKLQKELAEEFDQEYKGMKLPPWLKEELKNTRITVKK